MTFSHMSILFLQTPHSKASLSSKYVKQKNRVQKKEASTLTKDDDQNSLI